jgi:glycerol uptake facilitator-like aquaporin
MRQAYAAEFIGTFALVFAGTSAIVIDAERSGAIGHVGIGMVFGLVIMVMIYAVGHVSGAHFNPAVTLGFAVGRHFSGREVRGLFGNEAQLGSTVPSGSASQSLVLEIVLTFFLMFVIAAVATDVRAEGQAAAIAIGGTVGMCALFAGPISGASMNPARSLGPAIVSGTWTDQWIYLAGPAFGAVVAVMAYALIGGNANRKVTNA